MAVNLIREISDNRLFVYGFDQNMLNMIELPFFKVYNFRLQNKAFLFNFMWKTVR